MRLKSYKSSKLHTKFTPIAIIWNAILWLNAYALGKNEYLESKVGVILGTNSERIMRGIITYFEDLLPAFCGIFSLALPTEINGHNVGIFNLFRVEYVTQEKLDHFGKMRVIERVITQILQLENFALHKGVSPRPLTIPV